MRQGIFFVQCVWNGWIPMGYDSPSPLRSYILKSFQDEDILDGTMAEAHHAASCCKWQRGFSEAS